MIYIKSKLKVINNDFNCVTNENNQKVIFIIFQGFKIHCTPLKSNFLCNSN